MKRIAQFASILAILLLTAEPAFAGFACTFGLTANCMAGCPMAMEAMGPDCSMASGIMASACPMECCLDAAVQATESAAAVNNLRKIGHTPAAAEDAAILPVAPVTNLSIGANVRAVSPPRYILDHNFRI
jgi:hypothetical protein